MNVVKVLASVSPVKMVALANHLILFYSDAIVRRIILAIFAKLPWIRVFLTRVVQNRCAIP